MHDLRAIADRVDVLALSLRRLRQQGPRFRIQHAFWQPGTGGCKPGEEIASVSLLFRNRLFHVPLSAAQRILFDFLARQKSTPRSAKQIAVGIRHSIFHREHGRNTGILLVRKFAASTVKEYIKRLRQSLAICFDEAGLRMDPKRVVVSQQTTGNEVHYLLRARCEWLHVEMNSKGLL
jgi:hypothetical protein